MKRKVSFLISALCALCACASFTACMTDSQNGKDENIEKAKANTRVVEQQNNDGSCPDGNCPAEKSEAPDIKNMPPMPEFRFEPNPEHMPAPANGGDNADNTENENGETPEDGKKPPMPSPHRGGKIKPKMPKKRD